MKTLAITAFLMTLGYTIATPNFTMPMNYEYKSKMYTWVDGAMVD